MDATPITTIDQVIEALDQIIAESQQQQSPNGFFAALYRKVTISVKEGIADGVFEDGPRMEQLDVIFASRYIDAFRAHQQGKEVTLSWLEAFNLAERWWPIVLQHLLIGMNAHINLDLGIAAAEVMKGKDIQDLKNDFDHINAVLAALVEEVESNLATIWPTFRKLLKWANGFEDFLINFGMKEARDGAWKFAVELSKEESTHFDAAIEARDKSVAEIGEMVTSPGLLPSLIFKVIRLGERGTVAEKIEGMKG